MSYPEPSGEFEWTQESWGGALQCRPLASVARHCFSTRELALEGVLAAPAPTWASLARALGVEPGSVVRMHQVHSADVFEAHKANRDSRTAADIAISGDPSIAVSVRVADCVPVLLADRRSGAVAAVHAGWRGTAAGAVVVAVDSLRARYGTNPEHVIAAVGPSIGPCCYEVGTDLAAQFSSHPEAPTWFSRAEKPHLDLWRATRDQLARAGVPRGQIHVCELCTSDHPAVFHSYRRDGKGAGRLVAAIRSAAGRTP